MPKNDAAEDPNLVTYKARVATDCWWGCGGERVWKERTFTARLNPLKRTPNGRRYTRDDLEAELHEQGETWKHNLKAMHPKCAEECLTELLAGADDMNARLDRLQEIETALVEHSHEPAVAQLLATLGFQVQTVPV